MQLAPILKLNAITPLSSLAGQLNGTATVSLNRLTTRPLLPDW